MPGLPPERRYAAQLGGLLPSLRDPDGQAYEPVALPCTVRPEWWDEDAPPGDRRAAEALCATECPALLACAVMRDSLQPYVGGVWAGITVHVHQRSEE
jgi:hypothetical protein